MNISIYMTNILFSSNNWFYFFIENYTDNPENVNTYIKGDMKTVLKDVYNIAKIAVPVLIFVLSTIDFVIAVAGNEEQMKKASNKLMKRLIFGVLFFVIPLLLDILFALTKFGSTGGIK